MHKKILLTTATAMFAFATTMGVAQAGFPEKNITFVIPYKPGGGFDSTSRQIAKAMAKYLPNNVVVVPKNVPGAGGRKGAAVIYRAKADGYTIGAFNMPGFAIPPLIGKKVGYDINKVTWLGRMSTSPYMMGVSTKSPYKTIKGIKASGNALKVATNGTGSTEYTGGNITSIVAGYKVKHITGYKGSKQFIVGIIRGDADAAFAPTQTFAKFIQSGDIRGVVTFEETSSFKGVQTIAQAGFPELTGLGVERMVGGPPGLSADVVKILSDAIGKATKDADSLAWAKKTKRPFHHLTASQSKAAIDKALARFAKYPAALK